jgi:hypothetical protein
VNDQDVRTFFNAESLLGIVLLLAGRTQVFVFSRENLSLKKVIQAVFEVGVL